MTEEGTVIGMGFDEKQVENTYRLEPQPQEKFVIKEVEAMMGVILKHHLKDYTYEATNAAEMSKNLTRLILDELKSLPCKRFKFIVNAVVGQLANQGLVFASRSLWFTKTDACATARFSKPQFFCVATVHATYYE